MATDNTAIASIIALIVKATNTATNPLGQGTGISRLADYGSLVPDIFSLVSNLGDLPAEIKNLHQDDIKAIVDELLTDIKLPDTHAQAIVKASLDAFNEIMGSVVGKLEAVAAAVKHPAA